MYIHMYPGFPRAQMFDNSPHKGKAVEAQSAALLPVEEESCDLSCSA